MHEVDMTRCLLLSMRQWRQQHEPQIPSVKAVHLQVGDFTCVEPDQLVFTWRAAVQGSWLDGSTLTIEAVPLVGRCLQCNATYSPNAATAYRSPCCDQPMEEIVSGRELRIRSVEYSLPAQAPASPPSSLAATAS
ncbi:MAG: hydrogenase maturation nickel metallochaperone HypA [Cyanobium sp.]